MSCCCGEEEAATLPQAGPSRRELARHPAVQLTAPEVEASFSRKPPPQGCVRFSYRDLQAATGDFADNAVLGEGGFGRVYRGTLEDGTAVAVKCLDRMGLQGNKEFNVEVSMLGRLRHPNLVTLLGICTEGDHRLAVFDFMAGGSLRDRLDAARQLEQPEPGHSSPRPKLLWPARVNVALGAARGLAYLHEEVSPGLIHRDIKSSNVLIDGRSEARVADFGLAHHTGAVGGAQAAAYEVQPTTDAEMLTGTFGYSSPEWLREGKVSQASDVWAFGVVLLELLTGREPVDASRPPGCQNLVDDVQPALQDISEVQANLDEALEVDSIPVLQLAYFAEIADFCLQVDPHKRPRMSVVADWLEKVQCWRDALQPDQTFSSAGGERPTILSLMDAFTEAPPMGVSDVHYLGYRTANNTPAPANVLHPLDTAQEDVWLGPSRTNTSRPRSDGGASEGPWSGSSAEGRAGMSTVTSIGPRLYPVEHVHVDATNGLPDLAAASTPWHAKTAGSQHETPHIGQRMWPHMGYEAATQGGLGAAYASWEYGRHDSGGQESSYSSPARPGSGNPFSTIPPSPNGYHTSHTTASTPSPARTAADLQEPSCRPWGSTVHPEPTVLQSPPTGAYGSRQSSEPGPSESNSAWVSFVTQAGHLGTGPNSPPFHTYLQSYPASEQWAAPAYERDAGDAAHLRSPAHSPLQAGVAQMSAMVPSPRRAPPPPPTAQSIW